MRSVLDRLRLGFSLLCEYKFRHNCEETLNPLCPCNIQSETMHFFFFFCFAIFTLLFGQTS